MPEIRMYRYATGNPQTAENGGRTVITIIDLKAELAKLNMLRGRRPDMTEVERKESGGFATLAPFRDGNIFGAKFAGDGAWERHPNGDELVQIVDGSTTLHIMTEDGPKSYALSAGMVVIVPQGAWHRFDSPAGVSLVTATPKPTEHLTVDVEDPRTLTAAQLSGATEEKWR
jgi:mannose-6-phosphate isomerase-like protein (cupin superfamily)